MRHVQEEVVVDNVDDVDLELVHVSVAHEDWVKVVRVSRIVLQILRLDHVVVEDVPRGAGLGLELVPRQEHRRLLNLFQDHLVTVLDVV